MSDRGAGKWGAYYKAKHRGHGRGRGQPSGSNHASQPSSKARSENRDWEGLEQDLQRIDQKGYNFYKDLQGNYSHSSPDFILRVDHVQSDPYATPSHVRVVMPLNVAGFPDELMNTSIKRVALADFVTRTAASFIRQKHMDKALSGSGWSGPKGGSFNINAPGQEVLNRTSCVIDTKTGSIELRFNVSLPAQGRSILAEAAHQILVINLPELVSSAFLFSTQDKQHVGDHVRSVVGQAHLRDQLESRNLIAFIANGSILPRQSGSASLPMEFSKVVQFKSPKEFELTLEWPDGSLIVGMGIAKGITVLTGGGFHGKSTLLEALQMGVYNHIPGDGREKVVTDPTAFKVRAEDGRNVSSLDISPFISNLPGGKDVKSFSTEDASGSTSMAANIQEALELGSKTLLIDEDSSATNLLIRDERMQKLILAEPILPFVSKTRALFGQHGVSTVIVVGGCGDYLSVADRVIGLESYLPKDLTSEARQVVLQIPTNIEEAKIYGNVPNRSVRIPKDAIGKRRPKARGMGFIGTSGSPPNPVRNPAEAESGIELSSVEQFVEPGQVQYVINCLRFLAKLPEAQSISALMDAVEDAVEGGGLDAIHVEHRQTGEMVAARRMEVGAAINRLQGVVVQ